MLTKETIVECQPIRDFFTSLVGCLDPECEEQRLDFLACHALQTADVSSVAEEIASLTQVFTEQTDLEEVKLN